MKSKDSRLSRLALSSFLLAVSAWWAFTLIFYQVGPTDTPIPCKSIQPGDLGEFSVFGSLVLAALALVMGGIGLFQIKRSQGRLTGRWLANLGIVGFVIVLLQVISLPSFLVRHDHAVTNWAFTELHQAEERYRTLYPHVGYSRDLTSLGPLVDGQAPSAVRAGLVNANLALGRYSCNQDTLRYTPRMDATGKIVGYAARVKSRVVRVMDEIGEIRFVPAATQDSSSRR